MAIAAAMAIGIGDYGTPVIALSNNKEGKQGEFGLALEQGP
jgi:hypothetical protein